MKLYHKNPRQITRKQYEDLEAWLEELGDLSGIVHDLNSNEVVAGNQRSRIFGIILDQGDIVITEELNEPTPQGTVARGYVEWRGERFSYRQVRWTERQCEKANIVANKAGGTEDWDALANNYDIDDLLQWGYSEPELLGWSPPPSLDELEELYGEPQERDFWPVIRVQVSPETMELYESLRAQVNGDDDAEVMALILGAVDASLFSAVVP